MLPRAALHQENVISNEQLNRQRVEAGQIAPIFSVSTWSTLSCAFVITHPLRIFAYLSFSLWSCLLECEVNNVYTQQTRHHPHKDGAVENVVKSSRSSEGEISAQFSRTIVGYNEKWFNTTFFIPVCIFIASCTGVCSLWTSLTILALSCFFSPLSSPSWSLCFSLRIPCFFLHILYRTRVCMFYSALEFVYYFAHLSLCIIPYLFYK